MRKFCLRCKLTKTTETQDFSHTTEYFKTTVMITYIFYSFKFYWTYPSLSPGLCHSENTIVHRHWDTNQGKFLYAGISHIVWFSPTDFFPLFVSLPFSVSLTLSLPRVVLVFHRMRSRCFFEVQEEREQRTGRGGEGRKMRWMCSPLACIKKKTDEKY